MPNYSIFIIAMIIACTDSNAQAPNQKLEQVKNDPKTSVNAARADVRLISLKTVTDSLVTQTVITRKRKQEYPSLK